MAFHGKYTNSSAQTGSTHMPTSQGFGIKRFRRLFSEQVFQKRTPYVRRRTKII